MFPGKECSSPASTALQKVDISGENRFAWKKQYGRPYVILCTKRWPHGTVHVPMISRLLSVVQQHVEKFSL